MNQTLNLICEAKLSLNQSSTKEPSGKIEARVTSWGAREGADGRRFNYQPEGFMDWANEFAASGKPLPMFLNHNDMGMPVGQWTEFNFDKTGMTASGELFMNTSVGSDLYEILKNSPNLFGGVSVGAYADEACMVDENGNPVAEDDMDGEEYFQITKGGLKEVSIVMQPNNPMAEVKKLEFFREDGSANLKHIEKALRDAGLSRKDATSASSKFNEILKTRDEIKPVIETAPIQGEPDADEEAILEALKERKLLKKLNQKLGK